MRHGSSDARRREHASARDAVPSPIRGAAALPVAIQRRRGDERSAAMNTQSYQTEDVSDRRACFLNVSSKGGSDPTSTARTGASCEAATGCDFWEAGSSTAGSSLVVSSMAPLNARAASSPGLAEFFAEEPAVPPNPFLGRRSFPRYAAYADSVPLVASVRTEGRADEESGGLFSWLRNFLIGVLVASLLVVVASAGGIIDWTGGAAVEMHDAKPPTTSSDEMELVDARFSAAAPQASVGPGAADDFDEKGVSSQVHGTPSAPSDARIPTATVALPGPKGEHDGHVGSPEGHLPMRMLWQRECRHYFYTYCDSIRQEWYHKPSSHGCVTTASDSVHVCNRGANRFTNLESCFASCVHGDSKPDRCFERSLFTECDREDVLETWWFFDGRRCLRWNFPLGNCPSEQSRVFHTAEQCALECVPGWEVKRDNASAAVRQQRRCEAPVAATCSPRQLRYPYFADMHAEGSARCVRASARNLLTRRCLVGSNRFASLATCSRFCAARRPTS
ncbi:hypothetical protein HPB50_021858 [Hyalomma asiaticum]|uniref:Uncharacterized protein n=1 Tax=Hyalomma asiaticum TaxID=266040 RepID=A0ACB7T135_HYAAI|nr:hypothetical protein HPB50_021858 [Hyalomma asiaticum]